VVDLKALSCGALLAFMVFLEEWSYVKSGFNLKFG
jgi:hypothetical protein